ncbi:UDP-2,3-diacylglucosamine diphosphatase [Algoriphagus sediminis]|uniref:UDP-2,3-diacylglucosamine diphosphatase n=1 Tax=Algoriphagus sediminis TaxID=3057113 RepID=A0ABT7Y8Q4_9BACT|nr:UDP-2,3-diacylglucosamine diphosphatase [Algoriphagus sediminis]MDN3202870.1 UDP-2,3-diacylglucosamine diphosphatase [Algoriphagus sediminis]
MLKESLDFSLDGKSLYFASDFHLGAPDFTTSKERERKIIRWLDSISNDARAIFLVGDIFDFWFEYEEVIPKGFIPFISKISELRDKNIPIYFFTGNHDLWMKSYFTEELGIPVFHNPIFVKADGFTMMVGHGDGLGPGDESYKLLKKIFTNPVSRWLFKWFHPDLGIKLAKAWSGKSRVSNLEKNEGEFLGENEWLWQYCQEVEKQSHHDFYIFGHRHLPLDLPVGESARYFNLGEWVGQNTFLKINAQGASLSEFKG